MHSFPVLYLVNAYLKTPPHSKRGALNAPPCCAYSLVVWSLANQKSASVSIAQLRLVIPKSKRFAVKVKPSAQAHTTVDDLGAVVSEPCNGLVSGLLKAAPAAIKRCCRYM